MEYHLENSIAIGSGGLEFKNEEDENSQVEIYADHLSRLSANDTDVELLDEAGNISSGLAIRKHNQVLKYGKDVIKAKTVEDKLDMLARQNASLGGLILMSVAVSGDKSFGSAISKALSLRNI